MTATGASGGLGQHFAVPLADSRAEAAAERENRGDLSKRSYPATFIFNDPINYSVPGPLMGGRVWMPITGAPSLRKPFGSCSTTGSAERRAGAAH